MKKDKPTSYQREEYWKELEGSGWDGGCPFIEIAIYHRVRYLEDYSIGFCLYDNQYFARLLHCSKKRVSWAFYALSNDSRTRDRHYGGPKRYAMGQFITDKQCPYLKTMLKTRPGHHRIWISQAHLDMNFDYDEDKDIYTPTGEFIDKLRKDKGDNNG